MIIANTRRSVTFFFTLLLSISSLHSQIRNSVAIIRPRINQKGIDTYITISNYYMDIGQKVNGNYFKSMSKGGHGSGYLSLDASGRTIVITARHVVTFADKADLEFQKEDGKIIKIDECPVIYKDDDMDFAVLLIPAEKAAALEPDMPPLSLSQSELRESQEVWSAGYPGLLDEPAWQLGNGIITNRRLVVDEFGLPDFAVFIQHTAPLDPGNSGGPLLIGDPQVPLSWEIVGMNTWMVKNRQNANYAVSLEMLKNAYERIPTDQAIDATPEQAVTEKAKKLIDSLNQSSWSRYLGSRFISDRIVAETGWKVFQEQDHVLWGEERDDWYGRLFAGLAAETIRQFLYYEFYIVLHSARSPLEFVGITKKQGVGSEGESYRVEMTNGKRSFFTDWIQEYGAWRVSAASLPYNILHGKAAIQSAAAAPRDVIKTPGAFLASILINSIPLNTGFEQKYGFGFGYSIGLVPWFTCGGSLVLDHSSSLVIEDVQYANTLLEANAFAHFNLPIGTSGFFPYLTIGPSAGVKLPSDSVDSGFSAALLGGIGLQACTPDRISGGFEAIGRFGLDGGDLLRIQSISVRLFITF